MCLQFAKVINMNMKHSYTYDLDKNRRRVKYCPCGKKNKDGKFVPFKGFDDKGYCHSCGKTFFPDSKATGYTNKKPIKQHQTSLIPASLVDESMKNYDRNYFVLWLINLLGKENSNMLVSEYKIGTSDKWYGACIFWQIDTRFQVRTGKIMVYSPDNGKRIQQPTRNGTPITWLHKTLNINDFNLTQCLFGLHLLNKYPEKTVAICESEKTAIVASYYLPQFVWLATGGAHMLTLERLKPLSDKRIVLYPDLNFYDDWSKKTKEIKKEYPKMRIKVSDYLEKNCTEDDRKAKLDLCDYLVCTNPSNKNERSRYELIEAHWQKLDQKYWFMDAVKFPVMTRYNSETLAENLNIHYNLSITPEEYYKVVKSLQSN
jgi:hypothetical protein